MNGLNNISIADSINARSLSHKELSNSFIVNDKFRDLSSTNNCILTGPRGSGKTTLLRMLDVQTLSGWTGNKSDFFKNSINYTGVFIPTDRLWKEQFNEASEKLGANNSTALLNSTFIYHTLERLTIALGYRAESEANFQPNFRKFYLPKVREAELVSELSRLWKVDISIPSLLGLSSSIAIKKIQVSRLIDDLIRGNKEATDIDYVKSTLTETLSASISIINLYCDKNSEKWAFLFDELELAPNEFIQPLVDSMRGGHEDIIFKLSLSPYHDGVSITKNTSSSMRDQDLIEIDLADIKIKEGLKFSREICSSFFKRNGFNEQIKSYFEEPKKLREIDTSQLFLELASKDPSFQPYLESNSIDIKKLDSYTEKDKQTLVRKIKLIALLRNHSFKNKGRRRAADYYSGFDKLCQATDFNPRMLKALMNKLIDELRTNKKISISKQILALSQILKSFEALLATITTDIPNTKIQSLNDLVDILGNYSKQDIFREKFNGDPCTLFKASNEDSELIEAIGKGLNAGALIYDTSNVDDSTKDNIASKNIRLSYIFAHKYSYPLWSLRPRNIESVIQPKQRSSKKPNSNQMNLEL